MTLKEFLKGIADAIRYAEGSTGLIPAPDYEARIKALAGGGGGGTVVPVLEPLEVTENGEYLPDDGVDGFSKVTVNVPSDDGGDTGDMPQCSVLEYLEPTGAQYINTGLYPTSETKIEIKVRRNAFSDQCLFGSRKSSSSADRFVSFMSTTTNAHCQFYNQSYGITVPDYTGVDIVIELSKDGYYYNGELLQAVPQTAFTGGYRLALFALNQAGTPERHISDTWIYYCKIWESGVLIRDYIPVLVGSDLVCLYDKVEKKIYLNRGSGSFAAGPVKE